jgi:hypothetical protein
MNGPEMKAAHRSLITTLINMIEAVIGKAQLLLFESQVTTLLRMILIFGE